MDRLTEIKAGIIAHAIRLGKCPKAGQMIGGNIAITTANLATREMISGEKRPFEFVVTQDDIRNGIILVNEQRAVYMEPKMTVIASKAE